LRQIVELVGDAVDVFGFHGAFSVMLQSRNYSRPCLVADWPLPMPAFGPGWKRQVFNNSIADGARSVYRCAIDNI